MNNIQINLEDTSNRKSHRVKENDYKDFNDKNFLKNFKICGIRIEDKKDVM